MESEREEAAPKKGGYFFALCFGGKQHRSTHEHSQQHAEPPKNALERPASAPNLGLPVTHNPRPTHPPTQTATVIPQKYICFSVDKSAKAGYNFNHAKAVTVKPFSKFRQRMVCFFYAHY